MADINYTVCTECGRNIFSNGGHRVGCSKIPPAKVYGYANYDRHPLDEQQFFSAWDEATYLTDDMEGSR